MGDSTRRAGADKVARGPFPRRSATATSPDGTVLARCSSEDGPVVEFRSAVRGRYTEQSLSVEVTAAITDAVGRYRDGARGGEPRTDLRGTRAQLRKRFEEAVRRSP